MSVYKASEITVLEVREPKVADYPMIADDWSLAFWLGFTGKGLWYYILQRDAQYEVFDLPKKSGGTRRIHAPKRGFKNLLNCLRVRLLLPLVERLGPHITAYRTGVGTKKAVARHVVPCAICAPFDGEHTCTYAPDAHDRIRKSAGCVPCGATPSHDCPRRGTKIQMDLKEFFDSTRKRWIAEFFREQVGLNAHVSSYLARLMTINFARDNRKWEGVPQGNPCSGDICNLVANERLDKPIMAALNGTGWVYSRYADDMYFSTPDIKTAAEAQALVQKITDIVKTSGYRVNVKKTRVQQPTRQQKLLGLVINQRVNVPREAYRKLRAIVRNIIKHGWQSQIRNDMTIRRYAAWLEGKINYTRQMSPHKGAQLQAMLSLAKLRHPIPDESSTDSASSPAGPASQP